MGCDEVTIVVVEAAATANVAGSACIVRLFGTSFSADLGCDRTNLSTADMMRQSLTRTLCCSMRCMHQSAPLQQQSVQQLTVQLRRYASSSSWDLAGPAYSPSTSTTSTAGRASYPQAAVQRRTVSSPASASSDGSPTEVVDDVAISSGSGGPFDASLGQDPSDDNLAHDWSRSYHGLSQEPFSKDISDVLLAPLTANDIEIKPGAWMHYMRYSMLLTHGSPFRRSDLPTGDQI